LCLDISMSQNLPKIAGASLNQIPLDFEGNTSRILQALTIAAQQGVELLCLPELCLTGYGCEDAFLSEWIYTRAKEALDTLLKQAPKAIAFSVGMPVLVEGKRYNGAVFVENGKVAFIALKHHLASEGVYYEPRWFNSWPLGTKAHIILFKEHVQVGHIAHAWNGYKLAFEICEDGWRNGERLAHHYSKLGVDIILNPSASHFTFGKERSRHELARQGSLIVNGFYIYVNLVGNEAGRLIFDGDTLIYHQGKLLAEAEPFSFLEVNVLTTNASKAEKAQPELSTKYEEFIHAQVLGLYDYMRKSRSKGFALSLSGGADSSTCLLLVFLMGRVLEEKYRDAPVDTRAQLAYWPSMLDRLESGIPIASLLIECMYQRTASSGTYTEKAATALAQELEVVCHVVDVQPVMDSYLKLFGKATGDTLTWEGDDLALQNIQSRIRAPMIWLLANKRGSLLLTTGNRSENSVGYSTMDGDSAGGLAPIAGVDKHFVREWLRWMETEMDFYSLGYVNELEPSAELRPQQEKQTDEADLMPYDLLEAIERCVIGQRMDRLATLNVIANQLPQYQSTYVEEQLSRFYSLWQRSQWKRERTAPSFHLDTYSLDPKGWCRFPILSAEMGK
jgi:NAD+ synthase (glutamine-hydrolysing)